MTATAIAQRSKVESLRSFLTSETIQRQLTMALPQHLRPERFLRTVMTLVQRTPGLLDCSQVSILAGMMQAAELGLELSGPLGHAYLIPRKGQATFQVGYRGLIELAYRSDRVRHFTARTVYEKDTFDVAYGTNPWIQHKPCLTEDPGKPIAYYAAVSLAHGGEDFEVMTHGQVEAHRQKYAANSRADSPWNTAFDDMARKTVIKKIAKRLPLSAEFVRAVIEDDLAEQQPAAPVQVASRTEALVAGLLTESDANGEKNVDFPTEEEAPA